jgi:hypothetical protein
MRLFECDSDGQHGCDIHLERARIDEPINWDVNEWMIGPQDLLSIDED